MNKFVARMLELGAELDKAVSPIEISLVINDAEILYKNHIEQLSIPRVVSSACSDYQEGINMQCAKCDHPKYEHTF